MAGLVARFGKLRLSSGRSEPYAALSEAVIYQQLNGKAASTILGRYIAQLGAGGGLPAPQQVLDASDEALRAAGLSRNKAAALRDIARHALDGRLPTRAACTSWVSVLHPSIQAVPPLLITLGSPMFSRSICRAHICVG